MGVLARQGISEADILDDESQSVAVEAKKLEIWGKVGPKNLGVLKALVRFRQLRQLVFRKRLLRHVKVAVLEFVGVFLGTQFLVLATLGVDFVDSGWVFSVLGTVISFVVSAFVAIATMFVHLMVHRWPVAPKLGGCIPFEEALRTAESGDILLFSYPIRFDGIFTGHFIDIIETIGLKLQGKVHWTHVGVVLVNPTDGEKYIAEATTDDSVADHVGPGLCKLRTRLERSAKDYDMIAIRKLKMNCEIPNRKELEQSTFDWVHALSGHEHAIGRYRLDIFRAMGKIAFDMGFSQTGLLMLNAGYPFEFDCCYFAASVLTNLGLVFKKVDHLLRIYSVPHFSLDRHEKSYYLRTPTGIDWGEQQLIVFD